MCSLFEMRDCRASMMMEAICEEGGQQMRLLKGSSHSESEELSLEESVYFNAARHFSLNVLHCSTRWVPTSLWRARHCRSHSMKNLSIDPGDCLTISGFLSMSRIHCFANVDSRHCSRPRKRPRTTDKDKSFCKTERNSTSHVFNIR